MFACWSHNKLTDFLILICLGPEARRQRSPKARERPRSRSRERKRSRSRDSYSKFLNSTFNTPIESRKEQQNYTFTKFAGDSRRDREREKKRKRSRSRDRERKRDKRYERYLFILLAFSPFSWVQNLMTWIFLQFSDKRDKSRDREKKERKERKPEYGEIKIKEEPIDDGMYFFIFTRFHSHIFPYMFSRCKHYHGSTTEFMCVALFRLLEK